MKVSELLKKIEIIGGAEIRIEFRTDKQDPEPEVVTLNEHTPEKTADQVIKRAADYTIQGINIVNNIITIAAFRMIRRTPKPKADKVSDARREEQKQAIRGELDELKRAVADLFAAIAEPLRQMANRKDGIVFRAVSAVRRILTRIFRIRREE